MDYSLPKDPIMLLSTINMKLRGYYDNIELLCEDLNIDFDLLNCSLNDAGFSYDAATNQYHSI